MDRSYLFAPGHNAKLLDRVFTAGADALMLDLEDAVPPAAKDLRAGWWRRSWPIGPPPTGPPPRRGAPATSRPNPSRARPAWVRVNAARTDLCAADLDAVADHAYGIRIPKAESAEDVAWVAARAPGKPIICAIESASGPVGRGRDRRRARGGAPRDGRRRPAARPGTDGSNTAALYARSHLVVCSRAARIGPPIDSVYPRLADDDGLRAQAGLARSLGFFGKSAIHPRQLPVLHAVFTPTEQELAWAREVLAAFEAADGGAVAWPTASSSTCRWRCGRSGCSPAHDRCLRDMTCLSAPHVPQPTIKGGPRAARRPAR